MLTILKSLSQTSQVSQNLTTAVSQQESLLLCMYCSSDPPEVNEVLALAFCAAACRHLLASRSVAVVYVPMSCKAVNPYNNIHNVYKPIQDDNSIGCAYFNTQGTGPTQLYLCIAEFCCSIGVDVTCACIATAQHSPQHDCVPQACNCS